MALHFDYASAAAPTSSKRPAPTATRGSSYTAPLALRFLYSFNEVERLAKINGDLGRLGGQLKLWLTNDVRTAQYGESVIRAVLDRILHTQAKMLEIMKLIVMPKASL
jgi:hypothetical protein